MEKNRVILEAIAKRHCIGAVYNRGTVLIAPHIIYARHGELFVDATTVARDGQPPRETKLGTFKLAGLGEPRLTETEFTPDPVFDPTAERYDEQVLFAVA